MKISTSFRIVLLSVLIFVVYINALNGAFHYDDFHSIVLNPHIRFLTNFHLFFFDPTLFSVDIEKAMYRPLLLCSYAINYAISNYDAKGFLIVNLVIHICSSVCVFGISRRIIKCSNIAFLGSLFFSLHPLTTESVNYVSSRSESFAVLLCLASFYFHISSRSIGGYAVAWFFSWLSLLVKSVSVFLPLIVLSYDIFWRDKRPEWRDHLPYWLGVFIYLIVIIYNGFLLPSIAQAPRGIVEQLLTQVKALVYYTYIWVMPISLNIEHQFFASTNIFENSFIWAALFMSSTVFLFFMIFPNKIRFFFVWTIAFLLPTILVPLNVLVNEHRLYMSLAPLGFGLGFVIYRKVFNPQIAIAWLVIFSAIVFSRNETWSSDYTLWKDSAEKSPKMVRPWLYWGNVMRFADMYSSAESSYRKVLDINPSHRSARTNLATIYLERSESNEANALHFLTVAKNHYEKVLAIDPNYREALLNLGTLYSKLGQWKQADSLFTRCALLSPNYPDASYNAALSAIELGETERAIPWIKRSLELNENLDSWSLLARAHTTINDFENAIYAYNKALEFNEKDIIVCFNLAEVLLVYGQISIGKGEKNIGLERWLKAKELLVQVISINPNHTKALTRLNQLNERIK